VKDPDGPIITATLDIVTGSIAFVVAPALRCRGIGRAMLAALTQQEAAGRTISPSGAPCQRGSRTARR
jgi:GNAT superfamily N-acetyltransferase